MHLVAFFVVAGLRNVLSIFCVVSFPSAAREAIPCTESKSRIVSKIGLNFASIISC